MVYNNVKEIKNLLLLESENQTLDDGQITTYLEDAQTQLFNEIGRNRETDYFYFKDKDLDENEEVTFVTYFVIEEIKEVRDATNNKIISSDNYSIVREGNAIKIKTGSTNADLDPIIAIEVDYIPKNYKLTERAIAIENILTRLQPFSDEKINPSLMTWREKRKNYINLIKGHFGVGSFW